MGANVLKQQRWRRQGRRKLKNIFNIDTREYEVIDTSVLLENTSLVKFIRNYIRDSSGAFSIWSLVKISMISSLPLKLYLNYMIETELRIFLESLQQSSQCSGTFVWPSEQVWKILGNLPKVVGNLPKIAKNVISVCLYKL